MHSRRVYTHKHTSNAHTVAQSTCVSRCSLLTVQTGSTTVRSLSRSVTRVYHQKGMRVREAQLMYCANQRNPSP